MRNVNLGGSWMDEFYRIAKEKGWAIQKEAISHSEVEKFWGSLPSDIKDTIIPGWGNMSFSDLMDKVELKWVAIMTEYKKLQSPKGDVTFDPSRVKVDQPEKLEPKPSRMSPQLISSIQALLFKATGMPVSNPKSEFLGGPDGSWGPMSAAAWNKYIERYTTPGGPLVVDPVDENGKELPRAESIRYVLSNPKLDLKADDMMSEANDPYKEWASNMPELSPGDTNIQVPTSEGVFQKMHGKAPGQQRGDISVSPTDWRSRYRGVRGIPDDVSEAEHLSAMRLLRQQGLSGPVKDKNQYMQALKQVRENRSMQARKPQTFVPKVPEWAKSDDVTASVVNELASLANDLDSLGEEKAAMFIDHQLRSYAASVKKLYDITGETGEQLINQCHPGGGPTVVPAQDEGGKVETIVEENKKMIDKATKPPTGKYASTMAKLIATANKLEDDGEFEAAKIVDKTINDLRKSSPFVNRSAAFEAAGSKDNNASVKEALWGEVFTGVTGIPPHPLMPGWAITSVEKVSSDTKDLIKVFNTIADLQRELRAQIKGTIDYLRGQAGLFSSLERLPYNAQNRDKIKQAIAKYRVGLDSVKKVIGQVRSSISTWTGIKGWGLKLDDAYSDIVESLNKLEDGVESSAEIETLNAPGKNTTPGTQSNRVLQNYRTKLKELSDILNNPNDTLLGALDKDRTNAWKKVKMLSAWANKEITKNYDIDQAGIELDSLYSRVIKPLQQHGVKIASLKQKIAASPFAVQGPAAHVITPEQAQVKHKKDMDDAARKFRGPRKPREQKDTNVEALQKALQAAGFSPGTLDGYWGPKTAGAWNAFLAKAPIGVEKYMKQIQSPAKQKHRNRPIGAIQLATRIVNYVSSKKEKTGTSFIPLHGGINVPLRVVSDPRVFVEYMQSTLGSRSFPPSVALEYLKELSTYTYDNEFDMETKARGSVEQWRSSINGLMRQFQNYLTQEPKSSEQAPGQAPVEKGYVYPWQRGQGGQGGTSEKPSDSSSVNYQRRTDWKPGSKDGGIKGLQYPAQLNTMDDLKLAIAYLPSGFVLSTPQNFMTYAYSVFRRKGGPTKLPNTYQEAAKLYFGMLRSRVADILAAIGDLSGEMRATQPGLLRDMEEDTLLFNRALMTIGEKLGLV